MGPASLGGSSERRKFSTYREIPSLMGTSARTEGELQSLRRERNNRFSEAKAERNLHR